MIENNKNRKVIAIILDEYQEQLYGDYLCEEKMPFEDHIVEVVVSKNFIN